MVISKKPLHFIIATLVAFLPLASIANNVEDTTTVAVEETHVEATTHEEAPAHGEAHAEPTDVKSKIKEFIAHHLLDAHDFTFNVDEVASKHNGFHLPIILWDNGFQVFSSEEFDHNL